MRTRLMLLATLAVLPVALPVAAQQFSSLEERMSAADFRAAGMDKLTPQELQFLDGWLRTHGLVQAGTAPAENAPAAMATETSREKFTAHLVGAFSGWAGASVFNLDNGQVWKQAEDGGYQCPKVDNPEVTLKPMVLGSWLMYIQGCNQSLRVTRVK